MKNDSDVDDVLQETFIEAYRHIGQLREPAVFRAWLYKIALYQCNRVFRRNKPLNFSEVEESVIASIPDENAEFLPLSVLEDKEAADLILRLVDRLPAEQRQSLMLFYFQQMSIAEIAKIMDCPENTVKSRLRYARQTLKAGIEKEQHKGTLLFSSVVAALFLLPLRFG